MRVPVSGNNVNMRQGVCGLSILLLPSGLHAPIPGPNAGCILFLWMFISGDGARILLFALGFGLDRVMGWELANTTPYLTETAGNGREAGPRPSGTRVRESVCRYFSWA